MVGNFCPILRAFNGSEAVRQIVFGISSKQRDWTMGITS